MEECTFCKVIKREIPANIIWEDESFIAFLTIYPIQEGHTLVIPKNHTDYIFDLTGEEYIELFNRVKYISKKLKEITNSKRIGLIVEGFGVHHAHVHLIPINNSNDLDTNKSHKEDENKLIALGEKYKNYFSA